MGFQNSGHPKIWGTQFMVPSKPGERSSSCPRPSPWATHHLVHPIICSPIPWATKILGAKRNLATLMPKRLSCPNVPHIWSPPHLVALTSGLAPLAERQLRAQPGAGHRRRAFFLVNQIYGQPNCGPSSCYGAFVSWTPLIRLPLVLTDRRPGTVLRHRTRESGLIMFWWTIFLVARIWGDLNSWRACSCGHPSVRSTSMLGRHFFLDTISFWASQKIGWLGGGAPWWGAWASGRECGVGMAQR
jgi:hypothetical protein